MEKRKINVGRSRFKRAIGCSYRQIVLKNMQEQAIKMDSEKVTNMVGTFLSDDSDCFRVLIAQMASEKVACMVGTFLSEHSNDFQVSATKFESKRLPMMGTFLSDDSDGFQVLTAQMAPKKVACTVATFLPDDLEGMHIVSVMTKEMVPDMKPSKTANLNYVGTNRR